MKNFETRSEYYIELFDAICGKDGIANWTSLDHEQLIEQVFAQDEHFYLDNLDEEEAEVIASEIFCFARDIEENSDIHAAKQAKHEDLISFSKQKMGI